MNAFRKVLLIFVPLLLICFAVYELYKWNFITHERWEGDAFNVPTLRSEFDADGDRVNDYKDVLESAKSYVSGNPKYGFKFYITGWPDDNQGIDGDVVARALRGAGYDLKVLIEKDYAKNPQDYADAPTIKDNIAVDENIRFRLPEYQKVFISKYFDKHTNDYYEIKDWQPGDIVFFSKGHVAVAADSCNKQGMRFLIHHFSNFQSNYMQDVIMLDYWGKIDGHYRVSKKALSILEK